MYLPSCENRTSDIDDIISEKNERADGSSSCSNSAYVSLASKIMKSQPLAYALRADHIGRSPSYPLI